jgi:hypothetical protein
MTACAAIFLIRTIAMSTILITTTILQTPTWTISILSMLSLTRGARRLLALDASALQQILSGGGGVAYYCLGMALKATTKSLGHDY